MFGEKIEFLTFNSIDHDYNKNCAFDPKMGGHILHKCNTFSDEYVKNVKIMKFMYSDLLYCTD